MAEEQATIEAYESTLKELVNGKRLSASKMTKLTEIAMQLMEHDTQLVSILYRTHKSLSTTTSKISSLYAFDALCRAARGQATKKGLTNETNAEKGNEATFLSKVEGVLDGLVQDMVSTGSSEAKEKTKKILDIWTKSSTFPTNVLKRLAEQAKVHVKELSKSTSDPRASRASNNITPPLHAAVTPPPASVPTPDNAQKALLALLTSAAANGQTPANIANANPPKPVAAAMPPPQPQLDPLQVALLQQLANKVTVTVGNVPVAQGGHPSSSFGSASAVPYTTPQQSTFPSNQPNYLSNQFGSANSPPSQREPHPNSERRDPRLHQSGRPVTGAYVATSGASSSSHGAAVERHDGGGPSRGYDSAQERDSHGNDGGGGPLHQGSFRGGRGGRFGDRANPNHRDSRQFADREFDRESSPLRRKRSRSRSPPYRERDHGGANTERDRDWDRDRERHSTGPNKRGPAPYSPPHRPSLANLSNEPPHPAKNSDSDKNSSNSRVAPSGAMTHGKDEFGRDIRQGSEETDVQNVSKDESAGHSSARPTIETRNALGAPTTVQNGAANTPTSSSFGESPGKSEGLDTFDFTSFNPLLPASWVALSKAFEITNGYTPSQEELMMLISGGMMAFAQMQAMGGMGMSMGEMPSEQGMNGGQWGDSGQEWNATGGGRGRGFQQYGRGGFGRGSGGMGSGFQMHQQHYGSNTGYAGSVFGNGQETDAVVLGGASDEQGDGYANSAAEDIKSPTSAKAPGSAGASSAGGSMQKVGDKWIFVRSSNNASS